MSRVAQPPCGICGARALQLWKSLGPGAAFGSKSSRRHAKSPIGQLTDTKSQLADSEVSSPKSDVADLSPSSGVTGLAMPV